MHPLPALNPARRGLFCVILLLGAVSPASAGGPAPQKWAAPGLPVTEGLQVWLDADRIPAARAAAGLPALANGDAVAVWHDASGHGRHLRQNSDSLRPRLVDAAGYRAVRFDGVGQHLTLTGLGQEYREMTVFLVAAPLSNRGGFRGFLAVNRDGANDYTSGLTIDLGPAGSPRFQTLNPEGAGFGGAVNLMKGAHEFGAARLITVVVAAGKGGTRLYLDGKDNGRRDRTAGPLRMDRLTVGARFYTNGGPPEVRGFLDGDISAALVYGRALSDDERRQVESYLIKRFPPGRKAPARLGSGKALVTVKDPPPVQVFVPGFSVRPLPLDLPNINNVKYRHDGKLVALAYNGNIYLLSDTDGDGLEDRAELFWDNRGRLSAPIGMDLTPPGYRHGEGVFVASKGKCSLIADTVGDGKADRETVIASGWKELPHGVDALGVAFDPRDGSVYFGLGTANYTNGHLVDKQGKAHYRLDGERGTVLRVSPDFKRREIFATGIRFPVGMRLNAAGDLFCTDQEGATWLPNGNPFDELLHLEKGRHYGFPPRHPKHLPGVIDEPSVFDYAPQHQSTCGLNFNEPVNGGPVFGPAAWRSDALVTGYSRGKLYRTELVRTPAGHVARNQLLAALDMLPADACVSPKGDLVVAVHSGGPDWGSGPAGKGRLYKISYTGRDLPQPVLVWPQSPQEVRLAFDRPLEPDQVRLLQSRAAIEYGRYVAPGDRFEVHRPGYQVVQDQLAAPRHDLPLLSMQVTADRRTLLLTTAPHPGRASYALTLPGLGRPAMKSVPKGELPQHPETDLGYDLSGVAAEWRGGGEEWSGWLPHLDLDVARALTRGSTAHEELWRLLQRGGRLTLRGQLDLAQMLRPAVQPGSKLDHTWPPEEVTVVFNSGTALEVNGPVDPVRTTTDATGRRVAKLTVKGAEKLVPLQVVLATGPGASLSLTYHTHEDARPRALPLHRVMLPWAAPLAESKPAVAARDIPELRGGNWLRGRKVFFESAALCSRCHKVRGEGADVGPDLSNLPHRDYVSVLRDITQPSYAIHPDHLTQMVVLHDGRVLTGAVRGDGARLTLADAEGKETAFDRGDVETIVTSRMSLMPEGLDRLLGPDQLRDLLTFLMTDPPRMPEYGSAKPPAPRPMKEIEAVLAGAQKPAGKPRPFHVVLVAGKKDHGPGEHDYPAWQKVWQQLLTMAEGTRVTTAWEWPAAEDFKSADVMVFYQRGTWNADRARAIDAYLARGGGLVYIHYAVDGAMDPEGFAERIGLAWKHGQSRFRHGPLDVVFTRGSKHPVARNFDKVHFHDESYWKLAGDPRKVDLLATGVEEGEPRPLFWTLEKGKGRVFVSIPGHFAWTFDDPLFRVLLLRGIAWVGGEPVDRFNELALPGARVRP